MNKISTDDTIYFTKNLNILYAEDDLDLQSQTKDFFQILFKSVCVVNNGEEALQKYKEKHFDIVISDIKMPVMDGVELTKKIKEINPSQCIIITSAYNDTDYLLTFINLNIRQFIQKPINIENMIETLYYSAKNIVNENMVEKYRVELEENNKELSSKNSELQSLVRILDNKLLQIAQETNSHESLSINLAKFNSSDLNELKEIEVDISGAAVLISLSKNLSISNIQVLGDMFLSYSKILTHNKEYSSLYTNIAKLGEALNNAPENFIKRVEDISILLESFIYVLRMWRKNLVEDEIQKAFDLHASMINDIATIISIIEDTNGNIQTDMEFF